MTVKSSLFDVLPYLLSALSSFSSMLCYPLKKELQFMRLFFLSGLRGGVSRKISAATYLEVDQSSC